MSRPAPKHRQLRPPRQARPSRWWIGGALAIAVFLVLLGGWGMRHGHRDTGDSNHLVAGARIAIDCVRDGRYRDCGSKPALRVSTVGAFPLLQYLPAAALVQLGLDDSTVLRGLAWLNFGAFAATLALLSWGVASTRSRLWRPLMAVVVVSGPLLVYATSAFGEMLAAALVLAVVVAARYRWPVALLVLAALACLAKETLPPFVLALGILSGRDTGDGWLPPRRVLLPLVGGVTIGVGSAAAFNLFRYGTIRNVNYLNRLLRSPTVGRTATNFFDLFTAPAGGLFVFWTSVALLLAAAGVATARALRARDLRTAVPTGAACATVALFALGLATWYAPFGWIAWGPRLLLPVIPATAFVLVHCGAAPLTRVAAGGLRSSAGFAIVCLIVVGGALPQASGPWSVKPAVFTLLKTDATCPSFGGSASATYWHCFNHLAWRVNHTPIRTAVAGGDAVSWAARIILLGGIFMLLLDARVAAFAMERGDRSRSGQRPDDLTRRPVTEAASIAASGA